jgi:hypothetical protein
MIQAATTSSISQNLPLRSPDNKGDSHSGQYVRFPPFSNPQTRHFVMKFQEPIPKRWDGGIPQKRSDTNAKSLQKVSVNVNQIEFNALSNSIPGSPIRELPCQET